MKSKKQTFLLVFNERDLEQGILLTKMRHYLRVVQRLKQLQSLEIEWHIAYVNAHVPSYSLCSNTIIQVLWQRHHKNKIILHNLARIFHIPNSRTHRLTGNSSWKAALLARQINAQRILGCKDIRLKGSQWYSYWHQLTKMQGSMVHQLKSLSPKNLHIRNIWH